MVAGRIKVAHPLTLKNRDYPGLPTWAQSNYRGLLNGRERKESWSRVMQGETDMAGFEDGKEL